MTCAKVQVRAVLVVPGSGVFIGENKCARPQDVCPRIGDEGYDKCKNVCCQDDHAEIMALCAATRAGVEVAGAHMIVGYKYVCSACQFMLKLKGVTWECRDVVIA